MVRVLTNGPWDGVKYQVEIIPKTQKMVLCLTLSIIWYRSRVSGEIQIKE